MTERTRALLSAVVMLVSHGISASERHSLYTPQRRLLSETEITGSAPKAIESDYVWFGDRPVAQVGATSVRWTFTDHAATPVLQTDASSNVVWRVEREPYGDITMNRAGAALRQPLGFPGQEQEPGEERAYNLFRWYRGGWGRYTQVDPLGLAGDLNLYRYASDNPVVFVDPRGLVAWTCSFTSLGGGKAIAGVQHTKMTCYGPCDEEENRKWYVDLDIDVAGFSVGLPIPSLSIGKVELNDDSIHADPDNLGGPAVIKNIGAGLWFGYGHTEFEIGWAKGTASGWGGGNIGASFDVMAGISMIREQEEVCCDHQK